MSGKSTLYDREGKTVLTWVKDAPPDPSELVAQIEAACKSVTPPSYIIRRPTAELVEALAFYPVSDLHFGMYCWGAETDKSWDLKIAEEELNAAGDVLLSRTPSTRYACILGGGDALHADNNDNETLRGKNKLQVDGRYGKVFDVTCRFFVRRVEAALLKHDHVDIRILPGNHDEHSSIALAHFLAAWYRSDPRCSVDTRPTPSGSTGTVQLSLPLLTDTRPELRSYLASWQHAGPPLGDQQLIDMRIHSISIAERNLLAKRGVPLPKSTQ